MRKIFAACLSLILSFSFSAHAAEKTELTVYNQDFALVKQVLNRSLQSGVSDVKIEGVAAQMDPTSVHIQSLTAPLEFRVLEQNFEYDLLNYGTLLEKFIGRDVEVHQVSDDGKGQVFVQKGKLLTTGYQLQPYGGGGFGRSGNYIQSGSPMVEIDGKIHTAVNGHLVLPELPKDFVLKPALVWQVENKKAGAHDLQLSYMTSGIKWICDYVATVNAKDERLDLIGWVTLDNRSGAAYENASLKLVAGEVNRIQEAQPKVMMMRAEAVNMDAGMAPQFNEEAFFEYHLYSLQRPATVKNNEMKQIELMSAVDVPVKKIYRTENGSKIKVELELINNQTNHMGMPLPKGRMRIYKKDAQGSEQFVGEDQIEHTPKDEKIKVTMGEAFDLVSERRQVEVKQVAPGRIWEETWEIKLRNRKEENVRILVSESLYGGREWKIIKKSHDFEKKDAQRIEALIDVPKGQEKIFTYTVRYTV